MKNKIEASRLFEIGVDILEHAGAERDNAAIQVDAFLSAELRGHPSHGFLRLPRLVERIEAGVAHPNKRGSFSRDGNSLLKVDGQRGLGPVVMAEAIQRLKDVASESGVAMACISNSNHIGMLAIYAEELARQGLASLLLSTSEALVHPWGGRRAMIGTNPIAIGIPTADKPFVVDLATSKVSMGKIHHYASIGRQLEPGWALDPSGDPTVDAKAARDGAIAPFGDAKGYALGLAFEVLVAAMTSSALGRDVVGTLDSTEVCNKGDILVVMRPQSASALTAVSHYLHDIRKTPPIAEGWPVTVPGDRSRAMRNRLSEIGIELPVALMEKLEILCEREISKEFLN